MAFFRRIRSPREPKHEKDDRKQMPNRSYSTSAIHATTNGHRRHKSNEVEKIENIIYSEPNVSIPQEQGWRDENPPLPPRNRPASYSVGHSHQLSRQVSDEECYVAPADTLVRKSGLNTTQGDKGGPIPTHGERKQMHMHHVTLSQKAGHRRTHSFGQVIDSSDYSTPWNLIQQGKEKTTAPPKPPKGRDRSSSKMVVQSSHGDSADNIIPVMSPPPIPLSAEDRSLTNSPSSPVSTADSPSTPTSEHPPGCGDDYDEPWDKKFKDLHIQTKHPRPHSAREKVNKSDGESDGASDLSTTTKRTHSPKPPERHPHEHHHDNSLPPHPPPSHPPPSHPPPPPHPPPYIETEIRPRVSTRGGSNRGSPPTDMRSHSGSRSGSERHRISPQPDHDQRPRLNTRNSERITRERSSSPIQPFTQSWSVGRVAALREQQRGHPLHHDLPGDYLPPGPDNLLRSSSVSIPLSSRRLPSPPPSEDLPRISRTNSPPCAHIDITVPLDEQLWYHGPITRAEAEAVLADQRDFSFLVRNSESCRTDFSLSIRDKSCGFIHLRIVYGRNGYVLGQFSSQFRTVPECIAFYTRQRLNIRGTEHKRLKYPVSR